MQSISGTLWNFISENCIFFGQLVGDLAPHCMEQWLLLYLLEFPVTYAIDVCAWRRFYTIVVFVANACCLHMSIYQNHMV
jgi:hypothetical protein